MIYHPINEAEEIILNVIMECTDENQLTEEDAKSLAKAIAKRLEDTST